MKKHGLKLKTSSSSVRKFLNKSRRTLLWIPVLTLICGLTLSYSIYKRMHEREVSDQWAESAKRSKEIIQSLDLQLSNSVLRIQSYEDYIGPRASDYRRDSFYLTQSLRYTIFQRFSIFQLKSQQGAIPHLKLVTRVNTPNSGVPVVKTTTMTTGALLDAVAKILKNKEYSHSAIFERDGVPLFSYVVRSRLHENYFFVYTAPLLVIFDKTELRPSESMDVLDDNSGKSWTISSDGARKKITSGKASAKNIDGNVLMQSLKVGEPPQTALKVFFHFNASESHDRLRPSAVTGLMSALITLIIACLFWLLVVQNRLVSRLVIEKTQDLEQTHQQLQEALVAKTRFLGNISHEIRTPLNLILGMIDLCAEKDTDGKIKEYLTSMRSSGNHLLSMIEDLLDLAKSETNELQVQPKKFNLISFLSDVARISGKDCDKKGLQLYVQLESDLPAVVNMDPSRLRQILLNLLRNACKYTNAGHVLLKVSVVDRINPGLYTLRFEVSDTGIGIQQDKLQKVFDAFFQVENSAAFAEGGVGLGLAIVKELVRKLNGRVHVQSEPKKGSTFQVDLDIEIVDDRDWLEFFKSPNDIVKELVLVTTDTNIANAVQPLSIHPCVLLSHAASLPEIAKLKMHSPPQNRWYILDDASLKLSPSDIKNLESQGHVVLLGNRDGILERMPGLPAPVLDHSPLLLPDLLITSGFVTQATQRAEAREKKAAAKAKVDLKIPDTLKMLVADDDMGNQELYRAYFDDRPWNIDYVLNGQEALDACLKHSYDIIILDVRMPVMDGFEAAEKIRDHEAQNHLPTRPILLVTADAVEETMKRAGEISNLNFLTKPIRKAQLLESMTSALK